MELQLIGGAAYGGIVELPIEVLMPCRTYQDAMKVSMRMSRVKRQQGKWAELLGYAEDKFSRLLNCDLEGYGSGKSFLNPAKYTLFYRLTGNYGLRQWIVLESQGLLNHQQMCPTQLRKAQLKAELAAIEEMEGQSQTRIA